MVINPHKDCTWIYYEKHLSINLTTDEGASYTYKTYFKLNDLDYCPANHTPFSVGEAQLLTVYQEQLQMLLRSESTALEIGLNGVACERYMKPAVPATRFFYFSPEPVQELRMGDIVTVVSKYGKTGHCLLLEPNDSDQLVRLMLLNEILVLYKGNKPEEDRGYLQGDMIRLNRACVEAFNFKGSNRLRYA